MRLYAIKDIKNGGLIKVSCEQNSPFYLSYDGCNKALNYYCRPYERYSRTKEENEKIFNEKLANYKVVKFEVTEINENI